MNITGVIAEYNPFHNGHKYHLEQTRKACGSDFVVVVMSGDYVQRGEPAIIDKYARAEVALKNGADLVLELPTLFACASAPNFAGGAIRLLHDLGCVDTVSFGAEHDNAMLFKEAARLILSEPEDYKAELKKALASGLSYPAARAEALKNNLQAPEDFLTSPNNILGTEYVKALNLLNSNIEPFIIKRAGEGYHSETLGELSSATGIRKALKTGAPCDLKDTLPKAMSGLLETEWGQHAPVLAEDFDSMLLYELLKLQAENHDLTVFSDCSEEISRRILHLLKDYKGIEDFALRLKTKNYSYTRIMRVLLHILLEITQERADEATARNFQVPYARVLGFKKESAPLFKEIGNHTGIPLLTKMADADKVLARHYEDSPAALLYARNLLALDKKAADLYEAAGAMKYKTSPGNEISRGLVLI